MDEKFGKRIGSPKEIAEGEKRVAMTPDSALQLQKLGFECIIERGAGADAGCTGTNAKADRRHGMKVLNQKHTHNRFTFGRGQWSESQDVVVYTQEG